MIHLFHFITDELTEPFKDPRTGSNKVDSGRINSYDLFYKMSKENQYSFRKWSFVNVKVLTIKEKMIICKVLDNDLMGVIYTSLNDDKGGSLVAQFYKKEFQIDQVFKARINEIQFDKLRLVLTIKSADMQNPHVGEVVPNWVKIRHTFEYVEDEDYPQGIEFQKNNTNSLFFNQNFTPRRINHPHFKNISLYSAQQYLNNRQTGEFIIRPSSKGQDVLNVTWKFWEGVIMHLEVKEGFKTNEQSISNQLYISKEEFQSLDEIVENYLTPCNQLMELASQHRKFKNGDSK